MIQGIQIAGHHQARGARRDLLYRQRFVGLLYVTPSLLFLFAFVVLPIFATFYLSFTRYDLLQPPRWIGLGNFQDLLSDDRFVHSIANTLIFSLGTIPTGTALALLFAMVVNQQIRGVTFFRAAFYLPVVTSFVAAALVWLWLYDPNVGFFDYLLKSIGLPRSEWLQSSKTALLSVILFSIWKNIGYNMVIYLAGLQGIPTQLYEAAEIDGAGQWQKFWSVTLPMLKPTTFFVVVVWFIGALQMFIQVLIMTPQGGPLDSTITVVYLVYANAFEYLKMGYAAAMSFVLFLFIGLVTYLNTRILRYDEIY